MQETTLSIQGMNCGHCVKAVQKAIASLPGIASQEVSVGSARVSFDPGTTSLEAFAKAVEDEGYKVVDP